MVGQKVTGDSPIRERRPLQAIGKASVPYE